MKIIHKQFNVQLKIVFEGIAFRKPFNILKNMKTIAAILASITTAAIAVPIPDGHSGGSPAAPAPTYGSGGGSSNCKIIKDVEYREEYDTKCHTTYVYELCVPTYKQQCEQKRHQKCKDNYRTVYDTKYEEVCEDKPTHVCEKHWEEDGKGGKVWVDDPATCKTIYKTECRDEERKVPRQEKYQTCHWETYQECHQVPGRPKCSEVNKRKCLRVCESAVPNTLQCVGSSISYNKPNPHFVEGSVCKERPKQECREVHKEVPYQTHHQVCPGDDNGPTHPTVRPTYPTDRPTYPTVRPTYPTGSPVDPRDIADAFNDAIGSGNSEVPVIDPRTSDASGSDGADAVVFPN